MKSNKETVRKYIRRAVREFLFEAEEENPFGSPEGEEGGEEDAGGDEPAKDEKEADKEPAKKEAPEGIPVKFNASAAKKYNDVGFKSDSGVLKSIDKKGIVVTTQPDQVDVFVSFDDISENVKKFFKDKK